MSLNQLLHDPGFDNDLIWSKSAAFCTDMPCRLQLARHIIEGHTKIPQPYEIANQLCGKILGRASYLVLINAEYMKIISSDAKGQSVDKLFHLTSAYLDLAIL